MPSYHGHSLFLVLLEMSMFKDQRCVETAKVGTFGNACKILVTIIHHLRTAKYAWIQHKIYSQTEFL